MDIIREIMVPVASGGYIATCEGDDYWIDEEKLQLQVDFLDRNPDYVACVHNCWLHELRTNRKTIMYPPEDKDLHVLDVIKGGSCCYQTASLMCRREAFFDLPPFVPSFFDYPFSIHLAILGPVRYLGRVMSVYNVGAPSSWTVASRKELNRGAIFHRFVSDMLKQVDEYTGFVYTERIGELIHYNNYKVLYFEEKYSELRSPEYLSLYKKESFANRFRMRLKQYFPPLYHLYRKLKYNYRTQDR